MEKSSNHFENLGELEILPINIENESIPIISFMCIHTEPNCLIVLLKNGTIHHCVFMPSKKSMISNENLDQFNVIWELLLRTSWTEQGWKRKIQFKKNLLSWKNTNYMNISDFNDIF